MRLSFTLCMKTKHFILACISVLLMLNAHAQPVSGVWRGKVIKGNGPFATTYKLEVKLIRNADSITGTSYYFANANNYYRYSIKGYFDAVDGSVHWWDDILIEQKGNSFASGSLNKQPLTIQTDFNCPGSGVMKLDGKAETTEGKEMLVFLDKQDEPLFADGWNELIAEWYYGGADPERIEEVGQAQIKQPSSAGPPSSESSTAAAEKQAPEQGKQKPVVEAPTKPAVAIADPSEKREIIPPVIMKQTNEQKYETRKRVVQSTLPLAGDSVELQFYDNAEIDGDSISLFLNGKMIFEHVKLSAEPFVVKFNVNEIPANAELAMVAENLGSIPPNTAFMMAYAGGQRYTARLESTEITTAVIRFQKVP